MTLRRRINQLMKNKKVSFIQLYKESGCSKGWCWKLVNDEKSNPSLETMHKVARAFGMTVSELLYGVEE